MIKNICKIIAAGLVGMALLVGCVSPPSSSYDVPEQVVQWSMDNVWKIKHGNGYGSGFSIDEDTVITACHVVSGTTYKNDPTFIYNDRDMRVIEMRVQSCDTDVDVAVLKRTGGDKLNSTFQGFHPQPKFGKAVWGAGFGLAGPLAIHLGTVNSVDPSGYAKGAYYVGSATVPGDSGSPVVALYNGVPLVVGIRLAVRVIPLGFSSTLAAHMTLVAPTRNIIAEINKGS